MNMHVLVSLTNAITTYVYGVCVKTTIIYGATFGPPIVFLHQMINRFKEETLTPFLHVGEFPRFIQYVLLHRARSVKRGNSMG